MGLIWVLHALCDVNKHVAAVIDWMTKKYTGKWWRNTERVWWKISLVLIAVKYLGMRPAAMRRSIRPLDYERRFLSALPIPAVCSYESTPCSVVLSILALGTFDM